MVFTTIIKQTTLTLKPNNMIRIQKFYQADERNFPFSWSNTEIPSSAYQQKETPIEKAAIKASTPTSPKEEQTPMGVVEMAEEIYNDKVAHWFNGQIGSSDIKEDVLEAMYEYASQFNGKEAVEFAEWIKEYRWVSTSDGIKWMDLFGNVKTSQELYTLFLNTKTKQHEHTNIKS